MRCKCCNAEYEPKRINKYTNDYEDLCPGCLLEAKMAFYDDDKEIGGIDEILDGYDLEGME
jgi:hypothetical protein